MAAAALIIKYFNGECSPEEALYIEEWAASSPENRALFDATWRRMHPADMPDARAEWSRLRTGQQPTAPGGWFRGRLFWGVSSVIVVTAVVWLLASRHRAVVHMPGHSASPAAGPVKVEGPVKFEGPAKVEGPAKFEGPAKVATATPLPADTVRVFDFKNSSLEEATQVLGQAYHIQLVCRNPKLLKCRFTTRFDHDSLTYILDVITETLNIHYEYSADRKTVYLSGTGCE